MPSPHAGILRKPHFLAEHCLLVRRQSCTTGRTHLRRGATRSLRSVHEVGPHSAGTQVRGDDAFRVMRAAAKVFGMCFVEAEGRDVLEEPAQLSRSATRADTPWNRQVGRLRGRASAPLLLFEAVPAGLFTGVILAHRMPTGCFPSSFHYLVAAKARKWRDGVVDISRSRGRLLYRRQA